MATTERVWNAPGPGPWELESTHYVRPLARFTQGAISAGFPAGFSESTARYGLMLSHFKPAIINGFMYQQPVAFGAPEGAMGPPPKFVLQLLTRLVPKMRRRITTSFHAFEQKLWREDLRRWDEEVKPASIKTQRALQSVDPSSLDDAELAKHLAACRANVENMVKQHHIFTISCSAPVGDFLAHTAAWTKKKPGEILQTLRGSSEISKGLAAVELSGLAEALKSAPEIRAAFETASTPSAALDVLEKDDGPVGETARAYLDVVGLRCLGYDVCEKSARELPDMLVGAIRASLSGAGRGDASAAKKNTEALRSAVPEEHRTRFDELLEEARHVNRLRDERGHFSDGWAVGLARRAILEVGKRLVERGKLSRADIAVDATADELVALLEGKKGPSSEVLEGHATWRATARIADAPPFLNAQPAPPPPVEWLPERGRRAMRAVDAFITSLFVEPPAETTATSVKGLPVSPGTYEGVARLIEKEEDFGRIEDGDVLVTRATSPYFNVVLPLLGAIVTDRGGQLCHAAIVSREYGIPGVVGTRDATKLIKDGQRVRVNGDTGEVSVLP